MKGQQIKESKNRQESPDSLFLRSLAAAYIHTIPCLPPSWSPSARNTNEDIRTSELQNTKVKYAGNASAPAVEK